MSYVNIFGGKPIQPADVSYRKILLDGIVRLSWPSSYLDTENVTADFMNVLPTQGTDSIYMPSALDVSVGQTVIFKNIGAVNFTVRDVLGGDLIVILPGEGFYLVVTNNSTDTGEWDITQFGTGTSSADAATLAGLGLIPLLGKLNTEFKAQTIVGNYIATAADRATMFIYNGGVSTFTLPPVASIANGYFVSIHNRSNGGVLNLIVTDASLIDGFSTFSLNPNESSFFVTDGINWYSLGYGKFNPNITTILRKDVSTAPVIDLTLAECGNFIHQFYGLLTGNVTINYIPEIISSYYVTNQTSGDFNLILTIPGSILPIVVVPGGSVIIYSDGINLYNVPTIVPGTESFSDGSAEIPSIRFESDGSSGFFLPNPDNLGISNSGVQTVNISSNGLTTILPIDTSGGYLDSGQNLYSLIRAQMNG